MFTRALPQVAGVEAANFSQPLPSALEPEVKTYLTLKGLLPPLESATAKKLSLKSKNSNNCFFYFLNSFALLSNIYVSCSFLGSSKMVLKQSPSQRTECSRLKRLTASLKLLDFDCRAYYILILC